MPRENTLTIRLSDAELVALDDRKPAGMTRADWVRGQIAATVRPDGGGELPSREQVLGALWRMAEGGSVTACVSLARELRGDSSGDDDPLEALLRAK